MIFDPLRNELFTASRGAGAVLNDKKHPRRRAQGPQRGDADHGLPAARARRACRRTWTRCARCWARPRTSAAPVRPRSTWPTWPAAAPTPISRPGVKPWDIAAGILLVREAGGRVCDFRGASDRLLDVGPDRGRQPQDQRHAAEGHRPVGLRRRLQLRPPPSGKRKGRAVRGLFVCHVSERTPTRSSASHQGRRASASSSRAFGIRSCLLTPMRQQQRAGHEDRGQGADHDADDLRLGHALAASRRRRRTAPACVRKATNEVMIVRDRVWLIERLRISTGVELAAACGSSRGRGRTPRWCR